MTTTNWPSPPSEPNRGATDPNASIPWYRDVRVLRVLAQIVLVVLFFSAAYGLINSLVNNLRASNLTLDFGVYRRPFNVAISEGLSVTENWTWINNTNVIAPVIWGAALLLLITLLYTVVRHYQRYKRLQFAQAVTLICAAVVGYFLVTNPPAALEAALATSLPDYLRPSSVTRAFITGVTNTLVVVGMSLVACTMLGILVGIGLLSTNYLLRMVSTVYVEIFRNTPLLVQLIFIYRTLSLLLPAPRQSIFSPQQIGPFSFENNLYAINTRGFYIAQPLPTETTNILWLALLIGIVVSYVIRRQRLNIQETTGRPARTWRYVGLIMVAALAVGWLLSGTPYTVSFPELRGPNIQNGIAFSTGFVAVFLGLTLYTAAFIADIVRAGIQAVPFGQIEAARSQGLKGNQVLSLIVLPQALRLIIPPLGNQYVNVGKNSSLALAVGYVDVYRIGQLANNESGQAVPIFLGLMLIYLVVSLILSVLTNLVNSSTRFKTR